MEAIELTKTLVKSIDDIEKGRIEFDYEDFMIFLALVEDDDFTYYSYAPKNAKGDREFIPERCEIIAKQIFGKDIPAKELMDDDFYVKEKASYIVPDGIGLVTIVNFDDRCAEETIAAIETLRDQGAEKLIL